MKNHLISFSLSRVRTLAPYCLLALVLTTGCGRSGEAHEQLAAARILYEYGRYEAAKNAIDSLRIKYPREVDILRQALTLMRMVERGESERNIAYCDSLMPVRLEEAEKLKKGFVFEKNGEYEDTGNYIRAQKTVERNVERSYIRCGVDEKGEIYLGSVYFGRRSINHTGLRLSAADGTYAETASIPYDGGMNYRFSDEDNTTEAVTYKGERCIAAINFVYTADSKTRIKAEYTGGTSSFALYLDATDREAIRATYDLAVVLGDIEKMRIEKEKSIKKIRYIDEKLAEGQTETEP
ncbi:MAG: hypothetical protein LBJ23_06945 [Tannerella sp.]|jgi:hypothetical protein|nr:hypothetical protein [Tannerella sp.]